MTAWHARDLEGDLRALDAGIRALNDAVASVARIRREAAVRRLRAAAGGTVGRLPAWLLTEAPSIVQANPAFWLVGRPSEADLERLVPFALRLGTVHGVDGSTLPYFAPFLGKSHVILHASQGAREEDLLHAALLRVVTTFPPGRVRYVVLDARGTGAGLGDFAPLTANGEIFTRDEASQAVDRVREAMRRNAKALGRNEAQPAYNASSKRPLPYQVFVIRGVDALLEGLRSPSELNHFFSEAPRLGCAILASTAGGVRVPESAHYHVDSQLWLLHHQRSPWPLLGTGAFGRDLRVRLDEPIPGDATRGIVHQLSAFNCWRDPHSQERRRR